MSKTTLLGAAVALSAATLLALPGTALAAPKAEKKISYEEAFKRCQKFMDTEKGSMARTETTTATRTARAKACMQKFGHRI